MARAITVLIGGLAAVLAVLLVLRSTAFVGSGGDVASAPTDGEAVADWFARPLAEPRCESVRTFVAHELDHTTKPSDSPARLFDSNGSGVAADDLDGDGRIDLVLGNLEGPNSILWNEGDWRFTAQTMVDRGTRSVQLVDVDADGRLDIATTHRGAGVAVFKNTGHRTFEQLPLPGVGAAAYSMAWGDVDHDGDLDLVTGSYDAELDQVLRSTFLFSDGAGVHAYRNDREHFVGERLAGDSQALVTTLLDLDHDGHLDLVVGNDFAMHDMAWNNDGRGGFEEMQPFTRTAAHTMSIDAGDIDGDGVDEIFATDMKPASTNPDVLAAWLPLMATMDDLDDPGDLQRIRNVLHIANEDGSYDEAAEIAGVDAAGWSWSARFGDLDNDADVDLHVVNGMIAAETFAYLEGAEIVEPNMTFVDDGRGRFVTETGWGLDGLASGRGSILVDLDNDGALDVIVNNLDAPAIAYENRLCTGGAAIEVSLRQPGTGNTFAVGASVTLHSGDRRQVRTVRSGGGYLAGTSTVLHFGIDDQPVERLDIRWPDGAATSLQDPPVNTHIEVARS